MFRALPLVRACTVPLTVTLPVVVIFLLFVESSLPLTVRASSVAVLELLSVSSASGMPPRQ